jgi:flagellar hook assembly protein FlgD
VSLAVYDTQGVLVRTLASAEPQQKGVQTLTWDGLDALGVPALAGTYTWKALTTRGLRAEYLMSMGNSFGCHRVA